MTFVIHGGCYMSIEPKAHEKLPQSNKAILKEENARVLEAAKHIERWASERSREARTSLRWIDLKYKESKTADAIKTLKDPPEFKVTVSSPKYKQPQVLQRDIQNRKKLETKASNQSDSDSDQTLNFKELITREITHSITAGVDLTLSVKATAGFVEASAEVGLNLSVTASETVSKSFEFNPHTKIKIKAQHEALIIAHLYPIPEIHPFEIDVIARGFIPCYFKDKVRYNSMSHKIESDSHGQKLLFIPIAHIFQGLKQSLPSTEVEFIIDNDSVIFKVKGESRVTNYVAEFEILPQIPLPGAKIQPAKSAVAAPSAEEGTYESRLFIVGYLSNAGVTLQEVSNVTKDVNELCRMIDFLANGMQKAFSLIKSEDIKYAIDKAKEAHLDSVDKMHAQAKEVSDKKKDVKLEFHFTGMSNEFFKSADLLNMAAEAAKAEVANKESSNTEAKPAGSSPKPSNPGSE
jgi:hypothetical protein